MSDKHAYILGITGGIGAGKSVASYLLRERGIPVYDTDTEAKRLMEESPEIRDSLIKMLGTQVYGVNGNLNRRLLANWMFKSASHLEKINDLVHPVVKRDFMSWCDGQDLPLVGVESAILYESGFDEMANGVLLVSASEQVRMQRVMQRDGVTIDQVRARMAAQMSDEERKRRATYVLNNEGTLLEMERKIDIIINHILHNT